jgi:cell division protein FtsQ
MGRPNTKPPARALKWVAAIVVVLAVGIGANVTLNWAATLPGIALRTVSIKGPTKRVDPEALQFFSVDVRAVRREFESVPWVRAASVRRVWPDRLEVTIEEHQPLARWGTDAMVNTFGETFRADPIASLPRFAGPVGSEKEVADAYREYQKILEGSGLEIGDITLSARRAWQLKLGNGMVVELGRVDMEKRLARFVAVNKAAPELKDRRGRADLRYPNGFAVRFSSPTVTREESGKAKKTQ